MYNISGICTSTRHTGHTHTLHVTYTIDKHSLRARFMRTIYTICTRFTKHTLRAYNLRPQYTRTIYALELRVQSTLPTYAYNLRLSLARTRYTYNLCAKLTRTTFLLVWRARIIRCGLARTYLLLQSVPNSKLSSLFPEKNTLGNFRNQDWLSLSDLL